ncbi:hypothetical protein IMY05_C4836000200 [Salix suchowensis]|nr:hypothetical protein IMY05_C4836000200 [Salix suchowensis]
MVVLPIVKRPDETRDQALKHLLQVPPQVSLYVKHRSHDVPLFWRLPSIAGNIVYENQPPGRRRRLSMSVMIIEPASGDAWWLQIHHSGHLWAKVIPGAATHDHQHSWHRPMKHFQRQISMAKTGYGHRTGKATHKRGFFYHSRKLLVFFFLLCFVALVFYKVGQWSVSVVTPIREDGTAADKPEDLETNLDKGPNTTQVPEEQPHMAGKKYSVG